MVNLESQIFVSTKDYDYKEVGIKDLTSKVKNYFALTLNSKSQTYSFAPIEEIQIKLYDGKLFNCEFINCKEEKYNLLVSSDCDFITKRGIVNVTKLNDLDVLIDKNNLLCKMIKKEILKDSLDMVNVAIQYTYNYFCNGILIKGKI